MRAEKVVSALLGADGGVAAIVGARIYGGAAPDEAPAPLVIYAKLGAERQPQISTGTTLVEARIEVLCVATTYPQLKALGEAVRLALDGQGAATVAGVALVEIDLGDEGADQYEPTLREHAQTWTFRVAHEE